MAYISALGFVSSRSLARKALTPRVAHNCFPSIDSPEFYRLCIQNGSQPQLDIPTNWSREGQNHMCVSPIASDVAKDHDQSIWLAACDCIRHDSHLTRRRVPHVLRRPHWRDASPPRGIGGSARAWWGTWTARLRRAVDRLDTPAQGPGVVVQDHHLRRGVDGGAPRLGVHVLHRHEALVIQLDAIWQQRAPARPPRQLPKGVVSRPLLAVCRQPVALSGLAGHSGVVLDDEEPLPSVATEVDHENQPVPSPLPNGLEVDRLQDEIALDGLLFCHLRVLAEKDEVDCRRRLPCIGVRYAKELVEKT
mmetsp:Transcript_15764/g.30806  ORF Transcript_15764/g.30806 Transcript_15764/m.30806 type:complete len:306 (-) Transcript_15764:821-1738(-)